MAKKRLGLDDVAQGAEHIVNTNTNESEKMAQILFKCTQSQKENIRYSAKQKGLTVSGYIKMLLANDGALN